MACPVSLSMEPQVYDCGALMVNCSGMYQLLLRNPSRASSYFSICAEVNREMQSKTLVPHALADITLMPTHGWIAGASSLAVLVHVKPLRNGHHCIRLSYQLWTTASSIPSDRMDSDYLATVAKDPLGEPHPLATILLKGVYPTLQVVDIIGTGTASHFSSVELWSRLQIDALNVYLASDPTDSELHSRVDTRAACVGQQNLLNGRRPVFDCFLGVTLISSHEDADLPKTFMEQEGAQIQMLLENSGPVDANFKFMFPTDLLIEIPNWAQQGRYSESELEWRRLEDEHTFDVTPRAATLRPYECATVLITYRSRSEGTHQLPVRMKIEGGREVKLNLQGKTVSTRKPHISTNMGTPYNHLHVFPEVVFAQGDQLATHLQTMQLFNPGATMVRFNLDSLRWGNESHQTCRLEIGVHEYETPIFTCLNPQGVIEAQGFVRLYWKFRPLEAKTYRALCSIVIQNASDQKGGESENPEPFQETVTLEIVGSAYDPSELQSQTLLGDTRSGTLTETAQIRDCVTCPVDSACLSSDTDESISRRLIPTWVQLSQRLLNLGRIPMGACVRRLIHLTHLQQNERTCPGEKMNPCDTYQFKVYPRIPEDSDLLEIRPKAGRIQPGQTVPVELILTALILPGSIELQVIFEINEEVLEGNHLWKSNARQNETGKRIIVSNVSGSTDSSNASINDFTDQENLSKPRGDRIQSPSNQTIHPRSTMLHLTIRAQVVRPDWTQEKIRRNMNTSFIDKTQVLCQEHTRSHLSSEPIPTGYLDPLTHWNLCEAMLTNVISGLFDEDEFIVEIRNAAVPAEFAAAPSLLQSPEVDETIPVWLQISGGNSNTERQDRLSNEVADVSLDSKRTSNTSSKLLNGAPSRARFSSLVRHSRHSTEPECDTDWLQLPAVSALVETTLAEIIRNVTIEVMRKDRT
ncbi:unnamed protein product [Dicrocoelium dendriticum]|nr:unnamed protein product [Dicrocoelium dendriticum]